MRQTAEGLRRFRSMAREDEAWVVELFAGLPPARQRDLFELLGELKRTLPPVA